MKIEQVEPMLFKVESESVSGKHYVVNMQRQPWTCDCIDWGVRHRANKTNCKHIQACVDWIGNGDAK